MDRVRPGLKLSVAVGPSPRMYEGTDFSAVAAEVDEIGLMTYDFGDLPIKAEDEPAAQGDEKRRVRQQGAVECESRDVQEMGAEAQRQNSKTD